MTIHGDPALKDHSSVCTTLAKELFKAVCHRPPKGTNKEIGSPFGPVTCKAFFFKFA